MLTQHWVGMFGPHVFMWLQPLLIDDWNVIINESNKNHTIIKTMFLFLLHNWVCVLLCFMMTMQYSFVSLVSNRRFTVVATLVCCKLGEIWPAPHSLTDTRSLTTVRTCGTCAVLDTCAGQLYTQSLHDTDRDHDSTDTGTMIRNWVSSSNYWAASINTNTKYIKIKFVWIFYNILCRNVFFLNMQTDKNTPSAHTNNSALNSLDGRRNGFT